MQLRDALGRWLITALLGLGLVSLLAINSSICRQTKLSEGICQGKAFSFDCPDSVLAHHEEIGQPDDFGVAVEDSIEIFRVDIQQRVFGIDQVATRSKFVSRPARKTRPNISPPMLV